MKNRDLYCWIFLISASVLLFEISLIRLFSVVLFPGLSFLAISVALFGLAFGGIIVFTLDRFFADAKNNLAEYLSRISLLYGLFLILLILIFPNFNLFGNISTALISCLLVSIPFLLANIALSLVFAHRTDIIGRLYFMDLLGAGIGVVLATFLMNYHSLFTVALMAGAISILAAGFLGKHRFATATLFIIAAVLIFHNQQHDFLKIKYNKRGLETDVVFSKWNSFSRVSLKSENIPKAMASLPLDQYDGTRSQMGIEIDADAYTPIMKFNGDLKTVDFLRKDLSSAAYHVARPGQTLIIGTGGGRDILTALLFNQRVVGAEINPIIGNDIMGGLAKDFSGNIYGHPGVKVNIAEGRSFISRDKSKYDVINLPLVDTWSSTLAGNLALVENYLYTVEAFRDYLSHLNDDGILTISRWGQWEGKRLLPVFFEASKMLDISEPLNHMAIIRNQAKDAAALDNYLFKKSEFTNEEIDRLARFAEINQFQLMYAPGKLYSSEYEDFIADLKEGNRSNALLNLDPPFDNKPFLFFIAPMGQIFNPLRLLHPQSLYQLDGGLGLSILIVTAFTFLCLIFPFFFRSNKIGIDGNLIYLAYFGFLGLAFMFLEMALIQKFILYLEQPIYSYSVILATLLVMAGLGSFFTKKLDSKKKSNFIFLSLGLLAMVAIYIFSVDNLIMRTLNMAILNKILLAGAIHAPLAILMGMMLPLGFKRLDNSRLNHLVPWCWAINGAASVMASVVAVVLAIIYGFNGVLAIGGAIYALAGLLIYFSPGYKS